MKKLFILSVSALAVFAVYSCNKEVELQEEPQEVFEPKVIVANTDADIKPDTKTSLSGVNVRWSASDVVMGFDGSSKHSSTSTAIAEGGKTATFTFATVNVKDDLNYLIYPASAVGTVDASSAEVTLPSTQTATANSFANNANIAFAEGGVEDDEVNFTNIGGLLSIIINNDNIASVEISADEVMTGSGTINTSTGVVTPGIGSKSVLLNGGLTNGTEYYAVVYPQTYHNFRIEITDNIGKKAVFKNPTPLTVNRNSNTHLATLTASRWFDVVNHTIDWTDSGDWTGVGNDVINLADGDYSVEIDKKTGGTKPAINGTDNDARAYAKATVTVSNSDCRMTSIVFNISTQGKKRLAPITANVGTIKAQASGDDTVEWTGDSKSVVFTVGDTADYGSDGSTKAGQLDFSSIDVKILDDGKTAQTLTFPQASYSVVYGNTFSAPTVSGANTTVTYTSSDPTIAEVNSSTGAITINTSSKYGTTRITAKAASDATYRSATAYYDLSVVESVPVIYYINGTPTVVNSALGTELSDILPADPDCGVATYSFAGWAESTVAAQDTAPTYTSQTVVPAGGITLYAVFVKESEKDVEEVDVDFANDNCTPSTRGEYEHSNATYGLTMTVSDGLCTSAHMRIYQDATVEITSSTRNISKVVVTGVSSYPASRFDEPTGWTKSTSGNNGTWTGSAKSITLTAGSQVRATLFKVTLAAGKVKTYSGYTTSPSA